jgi:hypothetical protein
MGGGGKVVVVVVVRKGVVRGKGLVRWSVGDARKRMTGVGEVESGESVIGTVEDDVMAMEDRGANMYRTAHKA